MIALINGMVCACNEQPAKEGSSEPIFVTDIYSGGEVVKVRNLKTNEANIGCFIDVLCNIQLKDWDGRKYISVQAIPQEK